jgi:transposase
MAHNFVAVERDQIYLLPPSMADWLEEDHLAYFIIDAVEEMDLGAFYRDYRDDGRGGWAHDPKMMVALLLYAYCVGLPSSRGIERACHVDLAFRVIAANQSPDHTTIARFRSRHEEALKALFSSSLMLCARAGMTSLGLVALDGTKMAAMASLDANKKKADLDKAIDEMFAEAAAIDAAEDAEFGEARGDEPPAALRGRAQRRRRFEEAKRRLDEEAAADRAAHEAALAQRAKEEQARGKKLPGRKPKVRSDKVGYKEPKANTTDPDSRIMMRRGRPLQGYNAQAVANEDQVIIAAKVFNQASDDNLLHPMLEATTASLLAAAINERPDKLVVDAGYANEDNLAGLDETSPDTYISTRTKQRDQLTSQRRPHKAGSLMELMSQKVATETGRATYRRRQVIIEPVFGQIKEGRGIRRFSRRGLGPADAEWSLICGTNNLLKLYRRVLANPSLAPYSRITGVAAA